MPINPHNRRRRAVAVLAAVAAWLSLTAQSYSPSDLDDAFASAPIVISATSLACYRIDVWLAEQPAQQRRGLMFVRDLPSAHGMLFIYQEPGYHSMWMKNTFIPLDMLFIREDGVISSIVDHTEPQSLSSIGPTEPVSYVLELNAGATERLGIEPGDVLVF